MLKDIWANLREELFMRKQKKNTKRKKAHYFISCIIVVLSNYRQLRRGRLVSYRAILYSYRRYRVLDRDGSYHTVPEFLVFPFNFLY